MKHLSYPKIRTTLSEDSSHRGEWVATEKVHGANLVIATDGVEVRFGKRKDWLEDDSAFFGWQLIRESLRQAIFQIHTHYPNQVIRLYGELYGGCYPHPDVEALPGLQPVQTGIWYAPGLHFTPFDLVTQNGSSFASFDELLVHCEEAGLTPPPVVGEGTLQDVRRLPVRFPSKVHLLHQLPSLANNWAEGFVIKKADGGPVQERPMAKHKIPEFDEAQFGQATAFESSQHLSLAELFRVGKEMLNPIRIASARSKLGQVGEQVLIEEVVMDITIDLSEAFPNAMQSVDEDSFSQLLQEETRKSLAE